MSPPEATIALRAPVLWGIVVGLLQAATPLAFWWLDSATVYALGLAVIAAVYIGFAVADGRPKVIAVESSVTFAFVIVAAVTGSPWLLVAGMVGHGLKDLWQHRSHFVANTRCGRRFAWSSTGSSQRSSSARSPQACTSADRTGPKHVRMTVDRGNRASRTPEARVQCRQDRRTDGRNGPAHAPRLRCACTITLDNP